jgi:GAF domain-containing protein
MVNDQYNSEQPPQILFDRLEIALGSGLTESAKALRLLLEFANKDLKGQVATVLTPSGDDSLCFFESTSETFTAEDIPTVPIGSSIAGFVFLSGQSMGLVDAQQSSRFYTEIDERSGFDTKEYLATPVVHGTNVIGVLTVANRSEPLDNPMFSGDELQLADKYASLCALVLDHDNHIRRQTAATTTALRQTFSNYSDDQLSNIDQFVSSDIHSQTSELQTQVKDALDDLSERDLELVRDLAERLADLASREPA